MGGGLATLPPFRLERYFALHEFKAECLLSASDCENLSLGELIGMADTECLGLWNNLKLGYTESRGHPLLRREIASLYEGLSMDEILVSAPEEGILIAMSTMLEEGDRVIALAPSYQSLHEIARSLGCEVCPWTMRPGREGWELDFDFLEGAISERTKMIILNFPHNPTGRILSRGEFDRILEAAGRRGIRVFSDEMYRYMELDPELRLPSVCDIYERGISLEGLSKSFSAPGLRIGWLASKDGEAMKKFQSFKDYTTICNGAPSEVLALVALRNRERILERNLGIVRANLSQADGFFARNRDKFRWIAPQGGSVAFPLWLGEKPIERLCEEVLEKTGTLLVPGSLFDFPGKHFRMGFGRRNFPEALARFEEFLKTLA